MMDEWMWLIDQSGGGYGFDNRILSQTLDTLKKIQQTLRESKFEMSRTNVKVWLVRELCSEISQSKVINCRLVSWRIYTNVSRQN